jgi:hypothetical protein
MAGARDRKRAERQKRKRRSADSGPAAVEAQAEPAAGAIAPNGEAGQAETFQEKMSRRYEERNVEARGKLEPLERGERPKAVTIGAIVSTLLALAITVQGFLSVAGLSAGGAHTRAAPLFLFGVVLWAMAVGMWRARYWAVLGFQTVLLLMMLASAFGLVVVNSLLQAVGTTLLLLGSGVLFYFMVRAMARIQMPQSPGAD